MARKIISDGSEYDIESLSTRSQQVVNALQFTETRIKELKNMQALLNRAKNSYLSSLKTEVISDKAGLLFDDLE